MWLPVRASSFTRGWWPAVWSVLWSLVFIWIQNNQLYLSPCKCQTNAAPRYSKVFFGSSWPLTFPDIYLWGHGDSFQFVLKIIEYRYEHIQCKWKKIAVCNSGVWNSAVDHREVLCNCGLVFAFLKWHFLFHHHDGELFWISRRWVVTVSDQNMTITSSSLIRKFALIIFLSNLISFVAVRSSFPVLFCSPSSFVFFLCGFSFSRNYRN